MKHASIPQVRNRDDEVTEPAIPVAVARESGVRIAAERPLGATVDTVLCDLRRDPRSDDYMFVDEGQTLRFRRPIAAQISRSRRRF